MLAAAIILRIFPVARFGKVYYQEQHRGQETGVQRCFACSKRAILEQTTYFGHHLLLRKRQCLPPLGLRIKEHELSLCLIDAITANSSEIRNHPMGL